ncbi:MAG: hypothetical protein JXR84_19335 [Anaerolineae bacterium]|nr:hypothetical protein [Anaerolineae bacterium]
MKRLLLVLLVVIGLACRIFVPALPSSPAVETVTPSVTSPSTATLSSVALSPVPFPTPTLTPSPVPTSLPVGPGLEIDSVQFFPWPLYPGDWVSVSVNPRVPVDVTGPLTLTWALDNTNILTAPVGFEGLDARLRARFYWAWRVPETTSAIPLTFTLLLPPDAFDPDLADNTLIVPISPLPIAAFHAPEPEAKWMSTEFPGVRLYYLTGTAAGRDLDDIANEVAAAYADVGACLGFSAVGDLLDIYLLDRVIGHGGYASWDWAAISYTDRQYTPSDLGILLRHELTHRLDAALGCQAAPSVVREGLAVYVAGGHYWAGSTVQDTAALRTSVHYIPLSQLADDFYTLQHEVSYREAGAFIDYIVEHFGWEGMETFCRTTLSGEWEDTAAQLSAGLLALGEVDWQAFERTWEAWLDAQPVSPETLTRLEVELRLMEAVRAYQRIYDPGAHFMEGILFSPQDGVQWNITADFVRRPHEVEPVALELLLAMAQEAVSYGAIEAVESPLAAVEDALVNGFPQTGLAADVRVIVAAALAQGYEPYRLLPYLDGSYEVHALVQAAWPTQCVLTASQVGTAWSVTALPLSD